MSGEPSEMPVCEECGAKSIATVNDHSMCQEHVDLVMGRALGPARAAIAEHLGGES